MPWEDAVPDSPADPESNFGETAEAEEPLPEDAEELTVPDWSPPRGVPPQPRAAPSEEPEAEEPLDEEPPAEDLGEPEPSSEAESPDLGPLLETQPGKVANLLAFLGQLSQFLPEEKRRRMNEDDLPLRMEKLRQTLLAGPPKAGASPPLPSEINTREVLKDMVQKVRSKLEGTPPVEG
jgi:hypothetical protein